jgi:hypothetical protein
MGLGIGGVALWMSRFEVVRRCGVAWYWEFDLHYDDDLILSWHEQGCGFLPRPFYLIGTFTSSINQNQKLFR